MVGWEFVFWFINFYWRVLSIRGIVRIFPKKKLSKAFVQESDFLFEDDMITLSVGKGLIYLDWETIELLINTASIDVPSDKALLEKMKEDLEKEIEKLIKETYKEVNLE